MLPNVKNFYRPKDISEAIKLLNSESERNVVLGGGTQLALSAHPGIEGLVDLSGLGLKHKKTENDRVVLGARLRPNDVWQDAELNSVADGIFGKSAGNYLADVQRNRASLGGILVTSGSWAELATTLLAAGGEVVVENADGEKSITIEDFFAQGPQKVANRTIIKELRIKTGGRGAYHRLAKTETDIPIASAAVRLDFDGNKISDARVAVGAVAPNPHKATEVEDFLKGKELTKELAEQAADELAIEAIGDYRGSAEYRFNMAIVLIKRCLLEIANKKENA